MITKRPQLNCRKICVFFVITFILLNILFSYQFIIENAHHDCSQDHCPICVQLEEAFQFIQSIRQVPVTSFLMTVLFLSAKWVSHATEHLCVNPTLISLKVELLN